MVGSKWQAVGKMRRGLPLLLTLLSLAVVLTAGTAWAAAPGVWDLGEGNAVIRSIDTPAKYNSLYNMVLSGFNGGLWDGPGINSSAAALPENLGVTALGIVWNNIDGSEIWTSGSAIGPEFVITGLDPLTTNDVIIKYTYYGDANLDGKVDGDDQSLLDFGFDSADSWFFGDFNFSGTVDSDDQSLLDANFGFTGLSGTGGASPVPEPGTVALIFSGLASLVIVFSSRVRR